VEVAASGGAQRLAQRQLESLQTGAGEIGWGRPPLLPRLVDGGL